MANIGKVAIKIVADASQVGEGTAKAGASVKSFADTAVGRFLGVKGAAADMASGLDAYAARVKAADAAMRGAFAGAFAGGLYGIGKRSVAGGISMAGDAVAKLRSNFKELAPDIDDAYKNSQRLGVSMSDAMGLGAMGLDASVLAKFRKNDGTGDMAEGLAKLADRLKATESPADRVVMAMGKLGKTGWEATAMLAKGGDALRERLLVLRSIGYSLTDEQGAAVSKAQRAWKDIGLVQKGFWNQLAVGMAPAVEEVGRRFLEWGPSIAEAGRFLGALVGDGARVFLDVTREAGLAVRSVFGMFGDMMPSAESGVDSLTYAVDMLRAAFEGVAKTFAVFVDMVKVGSGLVRASIGGWKAMVGAVGSKADAMADWVSGGLPQGKGGLGQKKPSGWDKWYYDGLKEADDAWKRMEDGMGKSFFGLSESFRQARFIRNLPGELMGPPGPAGRQSWADSARADYSPASLMEQNSKEANSVIARWRTDALSNPQLEVQKQQLAELKEINRKTRSVRYFEDGKEKYGEFDV